jgi:hypothetical protein
MHRQEIAQLQNQAGVHRVLAGGAPMHEARGLGIVGRHQRRQPLDDRDGGVAGRRRGCGQLADIEQLGAGLGVDRGHRRCRDDPQPRLGGRESRLEVQHALQAATVREGGFCLDGAKQAAQQLWARGHRPAEASPARSSTPSYLPRRRARRHRFG